MSPKRWADKPTVWSSSALRRERGAGPRPAWMGSEHDTLGERRLAPQNHSLHDSLDTKCPEHWNRNAPPLPQTQSRVAGAGALRGWGVTADGASVWGEERWWLPDMANAPNATELFTSNGDLPAS